MALHCKSEKPGQAFVAHENRAIEHSFQFLPGCRRLCFDGGHPFENTSCFHCGARGVTPPSYPSALVFDPPNRQFIAMRIALAPILIAAAGWAEAAFGIWQINMAKSTFAGDIRPK